MTLNPTTDTQLVTNLINSQSYGNKSRLFDTPIFSARSAEVSSDPYLLLLAYFRLEFARQF